MYKFLRWFTRYKLYINRTFLFLINIIIIIYILPKEGRFRYDFDKNVPWKHEDLIAPFDFPVYKTQLELKTEEDSILNTFAPYFMYDTGVYNQQKNRFIGALLNFTGDSVLSVRIDTLVSNNILSHLQFIYVHGILDRNDLFEQYADKSDIYISIIKNNIAEEYRYKEVFTQKSAYEYIKGKINNVIESKTFKRIPGINKFLENYNFNQLIEPNLIFDSERSQKAKDDLLEGISLYKGKVLKDERIISEGEMVSPEKYQILESLKKETEMWLGQSTSYFLILLGKILFVFVSNLVIFLFLYHFRMEILKDLRKTIFILFISTFFIILSVIALRYNVNYYFLPFAILPIMIRTFYDDRLALFIHMVTIFIIGYIIANAFDFIYMNFITGAIAIFSLSNIYRRRRLINTSILIFITYSVIYFSLVIVTEGNIKNIDTSNFLWFAVNGLLLLLVYPLIYIFEKMFGFLSDVTLMELTDTNQDLLRKLADEAPGTFQHSLQVSSLAEEAVHSIGGNTLLVRAGALYHDIGKMYRPLYFTENQKANSNIHDTLTYEESAQIIIEHVTKGIEIARKNNLPEQVIDFIKTHHGTTTVKYFYKSFINKNPGKEVDMRKFRYPGPVPFSKETAILMMADSVEAASRSIAEMNEDSIHNLVETIIDYQMAEDQFIEANITFKDINKIKEVFKKKLQNIHHVRIQYPE